MINTVDLRIISYNIKSFELCEINKLIEFFKNGKFDIILLQEVDSNTKKNNYNITKFIAEKLDYYYYFAPARKKMKGEFGNSIITSYEIKNKEIICLPYKKLETRCLQGIKIYLDKLNQDIFIFNTHLDWDKLYEIQNLQIDIIHKYLEDNYNNQYLVILGGDFNIEHKHIKNLNFINKYYKQDYIINTWSTKRPKTQLDNIYISCNHNKCSIYKNEYYSQDIKMSDHKPLMCNLTLCV